MCHMQFIARLLQNMRANAPCMYQVEISNEQTFYLLKSVSQTARCCLACTCMSTKLMACIQKGLLSDIETLGPGMFTSYGMLCSLFEGHSNRTIA